MAPGERHLKARERGHPRLVVSLSLRKGMEAAWPKPATFQGSVHDSPAHRARALSGIYGYIYGYFALTLVFVGIFGYIYGYDDKH